MVVCCVCCRVHCAELYQQQPRRYDISVGTCKLPEDGTDNAETCRSK
jgi:hypothetical protein